VLGASQPIHFEVYFKFRHLLLQLYNSNLVYLDGDIPLLGLAYWGYELTTSVLNGTVPLTRLNDMATRIVATWYQLGQDQDYPLPNFSANTAAATGLC
jgi:hypothetical protein